MQLTALNKKLLVALGVNHAVADIIMERITALEKDKARLDKIDYPSFIDGGDQGYGYWSWEVTQKTGQPRYWEPKMSDPRPSIRDAIDEAS